MKIQNNAFLPVNYRQSSKKNESSLNGPLNVSVPVSKPISYANISFGALYNVKMKKINIEAEKTKLLRQLDEILSSLPSETTQDDIVSNLLIESLKRIRTAFERHKRLLDKVNELMNDKTLNNQQKLSRANELKKEMKQLSKYKSGSSSKPAPVKHQDEKIDYQLINRFRSAVSEDNFELEKVFKEYYAALNDISTVSEASKKYPKIKFPSRPEEVIAKKIESSLTRDFYEEFDELFVTGQKDKIFFFADKKVRELLEQLSGSFKTDSKTLYDKLARSIHDRILKKFTSIKLKEGITCVAQKKKNPLPQISESDIKLLSVDYDDFVLSVLRQHYLESKKLNDIVYTDGKVTINAASLKEPEYRFEKLSEKIKSFMKSGASLHHAQRDYDNFDTSQLKSRLNFLAGSEAGNNDEIFERIVAFDTSSFAQEDIEPLIKFLRELDDIKDGKTTVEQGLEIIRKNELRPKGTEKLNRLEMEKTAKNIKIEQQKAFKLNSLKKEFDEMMNLLYMNDLNSIASSCSKYRPENLNPETLERVEFIINAVNKNIKQSKGKAVNKLKLESEILRWDTFNFYKNSDPENPVYKRAIRLAKNTDGSVNQDKAGQYIINSEIVGDYPESLSFVRNPEVLSKIMEKCGNDTEAAISCLSKFDEYETLEKTQKTYLSSFSGLFDTRNPAEKTVFKHIIENEYAVTDTTVMANINESGSEAVPATFSAKAKQQILSKYKYPLCMEFLKNFEEALSSFASERGASGIKKITSNKSQGYKMELKLVGHDDRLFSSENNYYFDIFSDKGLH